MYEIIGALDSGKIKHFFMLRLVDFLILKNMNYLDMADARIPTQKRSIKKRNKSTLEKLQNFNLEDCIDAILRNYLVECQKITFTSFNFYRIIYLGNKKRLI